MTEYFDNIREIERRIQRVEARNASGEQRALPDAPIGVPDSFEEHVHILMDLIALAFAVRHDARSSRSSSDATPRGARIRRAA